MRLLDRISLDLNLVFRLWFQELVACVCVEWDGKVAQFGASYALKKQEGGLTSFDISFLVNLYNIYRPDEVWMHHLLGRKWAEKVDLSRVQIREGYKKGKLGASRGGSRNEGVFSPCRGLKRGRIWPSTCQAEIVTGFSAGSGVKRERIWRGLRWRWIR